MTSKTGQQLITVAHDILDNSLPYYIKGQIDEIDTYAMVRLTNCLK